MNEVFSGVCAVALVAVFAYLFSDYNNVDPV